MGAPKQNRSVGITLRIFAVIAAIIAFIGGAFLVDYFDATSRSGLAVFAFAGVVGAAIWNRGSRHLAVLGEKVLETDKRPPIVYLRSFANESKVSDAEMAFGKMFKSVGPFVAIGTPGEKLPPLGAARLYLEDENWKQVVSDLVARAQLIIIYGGVTPGLGWEVNHVKNKMDPKRTVIMVPETKQSYEEFRQLAKSEANLDLPNFPPARNRKFAIAGTVGFVTFDARWRPSFIKMPKAARRGKGAIFDDNIESGRAWAALSTICNKAGIRVGKPPRNWFLTIYDIIKAYIFIMLFIIAILVALYFANILRIDDQAGPYFVWPKSFLNYIRPLQDMISGG